MTAPRQQKRPRPYKTSGLYTLKRAVNLLGGRVIDKRYRVGKALAEWKREIIADLGGNDNISAQERTVIDLCVKNKLLLDSIDAWLLTQPTLVNARRKTLLPVVRERQQLADALAKYLSMLGLKRVSKPLSLAEYFDDDNDNETSGESTKNGQGLTSGIEARGEQGPQ